jgi:hypothetical protein
MAVAPARADNALHALSSNSNTADSPDIGTWQATLASEAAALPLHANPDGEIETGRGWLKEGLTVAYASLVARQVTNMKPGFLAGLFGANDAAALDFAQAAIEEGDEKHGENRVNTPYESFGLRRWLDGDGGVETLPDDIGRRALAQPNVQAGAAYIASLSQLGPDDRPNDLPPGVESLEPVTLSNGEQGYKAVVSFYEPDGGDFDGLFGDATVYYDAQGKAVGLHDVYDFTNDNAAVDAVNIIGAAAGSASFEFKYGVGEA